MSLSYPLEQHLGRRLRVRHPDPAYDRLEGTATAVKPAARAGVVTITTDAGGQLTFWAHRYEPVQEDAP